MSSFSFPVLAVAVVTVAACGFQPLYGSRVGGGSPAEFAQIKVEPIPDRIGQQLYNHLLTILNSDGRPERPRYVMKTQVTENLSALGVRKTAFATRANLQMEANYDVTSAATGRSVFSGTSSITVSYNILDSEFATLMAEKDARARAVQELSEDIRIRLGVFFSNLAAQGR
jgi:LPS-assembly lipoprotein